MLPAISKAHRNIYIGVVLSQLEDDEKMKKLIGLLVICFAFSLSAVAQHGGHQGGGGRPEVGGGHQNIPKHGPARVTTPHPAEEHRNFSEKEGHPNAPHVDRGRQWVGHDTGRDDAHYRLDHPWGMDASLAVSVAATCGDSEAVVPAASGSAVSSFR